MRERGMKGIGEESGGGPRNEEHSSLLCEV
jgi:hypothetical protein